MEVVKAMIHDQDLPMHLWDEATRTVVYVQNIIAHSVIGNKNLEEMLTIEKPEVIHLNFFVFLCLYMFPRRKKQNIR